MLPGTKDGSVYVNVANRRLKMDKARITEVLSLQLIPLRFLCKFLNSHHNTPHNALGISPNFAKRLISF